MQDYNTLINDFLQYKHFFGYKYDTDKIVLNEIKNYLIDNKIEIITREVTEEYAKLNPNLNSNTIARNMGVFRELCSYLKLQKGINCYQIPKKSYPQNHHNFIPYTFSHDEIRLIYDNMKKIQLDYRYSYYNKNAYPLIIKILYQTGIRIGELLNLTLNNYSSELGIFSIKDSKNGEERNVAIPNNLNEEIKKYCNKFIYNREDYLFKVSRGSLRKYFKNILILSNINITDNGPRLHDLRHTFVVHNIEKIIETKSDFNTIIPVLKSQLGHRTLESLSYYFHITNDVLNVVNKISEEELGYLINEMSDYSEE